MAKRKLKKRGDRASLAVDRYLRQHPELQQYFDFKSGKIEKKRVNVSQWKAEDELKSPPRRKIYKGQRTLRKVKRRKRNVTR